MTRSRAIGFACAFTLVILGILTHLEWFSPTSILTNADWQYWPNEAVRQIGYSYGSWLSYTNIGAPNIQIPFNIFSIPWYLLAHIGLSYDQVTKITFFIPVAIMAFISPYMLGRFLFERRVVALIMALIYGSTSYILVRETTHLTIAVVYALTPLVIYSFGYSLKQKKLVPWLWFALLYEVAIGYEIRITLIVTGVLALYYVFEAVSGTSNTKQNLPYISAIALGLIGMNLFWLLPTILGQLTQAVASVAGRGLFGNALYDIRHALALSDSSWTGGIPDQTFTSQPIPLYAWIVPALAITGLYFGIQDIKHRKTVLFAGAVSIIGVLLSKQSSVPAPDLYQYLYDHLPAFSLYREASKFYLLTAIGYTVLIGYLIQHLSKYRKVKSSGLYVALAAIIIVTSTYLYPLINKSIGTTFISRTIPTEYVSLTNYIINDTSGRALWVPTSSRWGYFDITKTKADAIALLQGDLSKLNNEPTVNATKQITDFLARPVAEPILSAAGINEVIVPLRDQANDDDFFRYYGDNRETYTGLLNGLSWLKKIDVPGTGTVAVYKNSDYRPYLTASNNLVSLSDTANLDDTYSLFASEGSGTEFNFILSGSANKKETTYASSTLSDVFEDIGARSVDNGSLIGHIAQLINGNGTLAVNTNHPTLRYETVSGVLTLYQSNPNKLEVDGKKIGADKAEAVISRDSLAQGPSYYLANGSVLSGISSNESKYLGTATGPLTIYASSNQNLIPNPSLEDGLWQKQVDDCNAYDNSPIISMALDGLHYTTGKKSLALSAVRHTACTGPGPISVSPNSDYRLAFDYRVSIAKQAGYKITFNDPANTVIKADLPINDQSWRSFSRVIHAPLGASQMVISVLGYPDDQYKQTATTNYDSFSLTKLLVVNTVAIDTTPAYTSIPVNEASKVSYDDPSYSYANIIENPSFETGLWQAKVGDCNDYDSKGKLGMKLGSNNASSGSNYLELDATRHIACTGPNEMTVQENATYFVSFDYSSPNATDAGYYIGFNDPAHTSFSEQVSVKGTNWQTFSKTIKAPNGATKMTMLVYSYADELGDRKIITRYDNFHVVNIPDVQGSYFASSTSSAPLSEPNKITFKSANPTKKTIHVAGATTAFYLNMSEAYHDKWQLEFNNAKLTGFNSWLPWAKNDIVPASDHYDLDTFANGWYIDVPKLCSHQNLCIKNADGSYNLNLVAEFTPQRWFYVGAIISGGTLISLLGTLSYFGVRRLKRRARS